MTTPELEKIVGALVPPVGTTGWRITVVSAHPTTFGVVPILFARLDGRPVFTGAQADCHRLYQLLTGEASRSASLTPGARARTVRRDSGRRWDLAGPHAGASTSEPGTHEAATGAVMDAGGGLDLCKACGRSLAEVPASRTGQRRQTCDDSCRQAYHRGQRAPVPGVVDAESIARLSRLSESSQAGSGRVLPTPAPAVSQLALGRGAG